MSKSPSSRNEQPAGVTRVSRAVAAFAAAWQAAKGDKGSAPRLEVFLGAIPEAEPAAFLRELLGIELDCRTKQGDSPELEDYLSRFPDYAPAIQGAFAERGLIPERVRSNQFATLSFNCPAGDFESGSSRPGHQTFPIEGEGIDGLEEMVAPEPAPPPIAARPVAPPPDIQSSSDNPNVRSAAPARPLPSQQLAARQPPAQQPPAQQPPAQQPPAQQSPAQQSPAQQSPAQQSPVQQLPGSQSAGHQATSNQPPSNHPVDIPSPASPSPASPSPASPGTSSPALAPGAVLGNYTIIGLISQGGMGSVYKAEHRRMGRTVAIKMISPAALRNAEAKQRFHREIQAMARLEHLNIVTAHDADQVGDIHFLVMQFVDGDDLWTTVKTRGPLELDLAVRFLVQTARGMEYAHHEGVVHRDIKPSNLVVAKNGVVKILDMGLARLEKSLTEASLADQNLTQAGNLMGTVDFMAPEQALDAKVADQRADIYSLGCTFYFLLTGQTLYAGDTIVKRIMAHRFDPIPALHTTRADVPDWLEAIFQKMVAKQAPDRYQSMTELITDLAPYVTSGSSRPEGDLTGSERRKFADKSSAVQQPAALLVEAPPGQKVPAGIAAEQTTPSTFSDTLVKSVNIQRPAPVARKMPAPNRTITRTPYRKRRRMLGIVSAYFAVLAALGTLIYFWGDDSTLVIEAASQEVTAALDGKGIRVLDVKTDEASTLQPGRHQLKPGEYRIDVAELPAGLDVVPKKFNLKRTRRATLKITMPRPEDESPAPDDVSGDR